MSAVQCECGEVTGQSCDWSGDKKDTVLVEHMPEQHRSSHEAAGNRGMYPHNGAMRIRVYYGCADAICDGDWTTVVS